MQMERHLHAYWIVTVAVYVPVLMLPPWLYIACAEMLQAVLALVEGGTTTLILVAGLVAVATVVPAPFFTVIV